MSVRGAREWSILADRCRQKTARKNVFRTRGLAAAQATAIRVLSGGDPTRAYRCLVCGLWHVGKSKQGGE